VTTFPDSHRDPLDAQVATLATVGGDGLPQLTEIWFLYDEGELKLALNTSRLKTATSRSGRSAARCCSTSRTRTLTIEPTNVYAVDMSAVSQATRPQLGAPAEPVG
jgi:hypothetical protein